VGLYREFAGRYGLGFVDDPFFVRRGRDGQLRDMVFERGEVLGSYLGRYLAGGQLERAAAASDRSWRMWWISPSLLRMSGWSLARCQWVRQGWHVVNGTWGRYFNRYLMDWYRRPLPAWWHRPGDRAWVCSVLGHPELSGIAQ
jgi:hypothetical protein